MSTTLETAEGVLGSIAGAATPIGQVSGAVTAASNLAKDVIDKLTDVNPQSDFINDINKITTAFNSDNPDDLWNVLYGMCALAGYPPPTAGRSGAGRHIDDADLQALLLSVASGNRDRKYWQATLKKQTT